jgi:hypothetical protein
MKVSKVINALKEASLHIKTLRSVSKPLSIMLAQVGSEMFFKDPLQRGKLLCEKDQSYKYQTLKTNAYLDLERLVYDFKAYMTIHRLNNYCI